MISYQSLKLQVLVLLVSSFLCSASDLPTTFGELRKMDCSDLGSALSALTRLSERLPYLELESGYIYSCATPELAVATHANILIMLQRKKTDTLIAFAEDLARQKECK